MQLPPGVQAVLPGKHVPVQLGVPGTQLDEPGPLLPPPVVLLAGKAVAKYGVPTPLMPIPIIGVEALVPVALLNTPTFAPPVSTSTA